MTTPAIKFVVSIATHYMTMDVMQATPAKGVGGAWKRWLAYLHSSDASHYHLVESITVQGNTGNPGLAVLFMKGLDILRRNPKYVLAGATMEVVLGPSLSRVGMVEMVSDGPARLSDADRNAYVDAWIAQHWKLQADDCVVCDIAVSIGVGNRAGNSATHMVTCIERHVVDSIASLCGHEGIVLKSCQPALASYAVEMVNEARPSRNSDGAVDANDMHCTVFKERGVDGKRGHLVHFLTRDAGGALHINRVWLNRHAGSYADSEVDHVIARLSAQNHCAVPLSVRRVHWPLSHAQVETV